MLVDEDSLFRECDLLFEGVESGDGGRKFEPVAPVDDAGAAPSFAEVLSSGLSESDSDSDESAMALVAVPKVKIQ